MNDILDLEPIARSASTEVAAPGPTALDLEKVNLTDLALAKFGDWRAAVAAATANLSTLALDLSTQARVNDAKSLRERLINAPRTDARKVSKALRSKFAATGKDVSAAEDTIIAAWDDTEKLITPQIDAAQKRLDDEKAEKARIEAARVAKHQEGIAGIRSWLTRCHEPGMTSLRVAGGIAELSALTFGPEWEEFEVPAASAQCETLEAMRLIQELLLRKEQENARVAEEKAQVELQRRENARVAAEQRQAQERLDAEAADIRRQAAELAAQQEAARQAQAKAEAAATAAANQAVTDKAAVVEDQAPQPPEAATPILLVQAGPVLFDKATVDANARSFIDSIADEPLPPTLSVGQLGILLLRLVRQEKPGPVAIFLHSDWPALKSAIINHMETLL